MPKLQHEALVQLVRSAPEVVVRLLRAQGIELPMHAPPRLSAAEFVDLNHAEYRADAVLVLGDPEQPSDILVVETQGDINPRMRRVWPISVAGPRVRHGCPVVLVVLAPDPAVARWCAEPIDLGRGRNILRPLVLGPEQIPVITDLDEARRSPELAVLSVAAHAREPGAEHIALAAIVASHALDNDRGVLYPEFVLALLGEVARVALEQLVMQTAKPEYPSEFIRKYFTEPRAQAVAEGRAVGVAEGRAVGVAEGRAVGRAEGVAQGKAEVLLRLLRRKFTVVEADVEARVVACRDTGLLDAWTERLLDAGSVAEVFAP